MPGSAPAHSMDANHKWSFRHWRCLTDKHLFQSRLKLSQVEIVKNEMEQRHKNNIDACCDFQIRLQDSFFQAHEIISLRYGFAVCWQHASDIHPCVGNPLMIDVYRTLEFWFFDDACGCVLHISPCASFPFAMLSSSKALILNFWSNQNIMSSVNFSTYPLF